MSDDAINIQISASLQNLTEGLDRAVAAITRATDQIATAAERSSVRHERATEAMGESMGALEHHAEHLGITVAFAMEALANGAETGVHRAEHALAGFAFMFGPEAGGIVTAIVLATDYIVKFFTKAREEEEKTEKQFKESVDRMINAGDIEALKKTARDLLRGTPAEGFADGIDALGEKERDLMARLAESGGLTHAVLAKQLDQLEAKLEPLRKEYDGLVARIRDATNGPLQSNVVAPVKVTADSPEAAAKKEREARKKSFEEQLALDQVLIAEAGDNSAAKLEILHLETERTKEFYGLQSKEYLDALAREVEARQAASKKNQEQLDKDAEERRKSDLKWMNDFFKTLADIGKETEKKQKEMEQSWNNIFGPVTDTFDRMVNGILQGTQTLSTAFHNLWSDFVLGSINAGLKSLAAHEAHELAKKNITASSVAERVALESWAAVKTVAVNAWAALTSIANYAWEGIAATWAAISAIPVVGPFLAPAMAVGAGAGILALAGNVHSAAGGFDIPGGVNPFTQLHAQEMVLPAELANKIRGMTDGGGATHNHIYAMDAQSFVEFAKRNPDGFGHGVAAAIKNNHSGLRKALGK